MKLDLLRTTPWTERRRVKTKKLLVDTREAKPTAAKGWWNPNHLCYRPFLESGFYWIFCLVRIAWYSKIYILLKEKKNLHTTVSKHNCFVWWIDNRQNHCCTERQWPIIFNKYSLSPHFLVAEPRGLEDMDQTRLQSFYNFCLFIVKYFS